MCERAPVEKVRLCGLTLPSVDFQIHGGGPEVMWVGESVGSANNAATSTLLARPSGLFTENSSAQSNVSCPPGPELWLLYMLCMVLLFISSVVCSVWCCSRPSRDRARSAAITRHVKTAILS